MRKIVALYDRMMFERHVSFDSHVKSSVLSLAEKIDTSLYTEDSIKEYLFIFSQAKCDFYDEKISLTQFVDKRIDAKNCLNKIKKPKKGN